MLLPRSSLPSKWQLQHFLSPAMPKILHQSVVCNFDFCNPNQKMICQSQKSGKDGSAASGELRMLCCNARQVRPHGGRAQREPPFPGIQRHFVNNPAAVVIPSASVIDERRHRRQIRKKDIFKFKTAMVKSVQLHLD